MVSLKAKRRVVDHERVVHYIHTDAIQRQHDAWWKAQTPEYRKMVRRIKRIIKTMFALADVEDVQHVDDKAQHQDDDKRYLPPSQRCNKK